MSIFERKILKQPPRVMELVKRDRRKQPREASLSDVAAAVEPLMGLVASGQIPYEQIGPEAIKANLDSLYKNVGGGYDE